METPTASILILAGTIVGFSFAARSATAAPVTGIVTLQGDAIIDNATREEDGSWKYELAPGRTYFCAGGLAQILPR